MNAKSLTVVAIMKAKPGKEDALRKELLALIPPTRKESGCINYDLHQDIGNPGLFVFHENWTSKAHLDAHLNNTHLRAFVAKAPELLEGSMNVMLCEKIG